MFLHPDDKDPSPSQIDKIISAEIPDKNSDPEGYEAVQNYMIHGPCGQAHPKSPCMVDKSCAKHFPKNFCTETTIDEDNYPIYRRRDDGNTVDKNGVKLDNRFVVPYNRNLLVKYQAHINVEWCNRSRSIKYLFKYIHKGEDRTTVLIEAEDQQSETRASKLTNRDDEIKRYLDARYISGCEAAWRIFQFPLQYREPAVERLQFHLENEHVVVFPDSMDLDQIVSRPNIEKTMFTEWMTANQLHEEARSLTYAQFPTKWTWHAQ